MTADTTAPDPTAVMARRVIAHLLDAALYAAAALIPLALFTDSRSIEVGESLDRVGRLNGDDPYLLRGDTVYTVTDSEVVTAALIALGVFLLTAVVMQGLTGRTVGKFVTGIRAVRPDGAIPGIGRAFIRELCWIIDGIPSFVIALVGGILALVTTGRRRIGDFLGRTYVVHRRFAGTPIVHPVDVDAAAEGTEATAAAGAAAGAAADDSVEAPPVDDRTAEGAAGAHAAAEPEPEPAEPLEPGEMWAWEPAEPDTTPEQDEPAEEPAEAEASTTSSDEPTAPRWDPDRRAYISYDPRRGGWLQHDTETGEWGPISRA